MLVGGCYSQIFQKKRYNGYWLCTNPWFKVQNFKIYNKFTTTLILQES